MCVVFIYTHKIYTQYTHIYVNKSLFWMRLIVRQHYFFANKLQNFTVIKFQHTHDVSSLFISANFESKPHIQNILRHILAVKQKSTDVMFAFILVKDRTVFRCCSLRIFSNQRNAGIRGCNSYKESI